MAMLQSINAVGSQLAGGPSPDYTPPSMIWKDTDEIYLPKGRYYKAGYRFNGQYQDLTNIGSYWDLADRAAVDIDATYSAGSTSGMIGGAKVVSSWYSVFMVGQGILVVLPFVRVDTITYSAPNTIITPAAHADGTTAADGFIVANDAWNNYRLVLINDDPTESGSVYTISDCATGSPDTILITGDVTGTIAATEHLQLIPPADVPCLYLGPVKIHSDGTLRWFKKNRWLYEMPDRTILNATCNLTPAATDLGGAIPPTATSFVAGCKISHSAGNATGLTANHYRGVSGTDIVEQVLPFDNLSAAALLSSICQNFPLSAVAKIKNSFQAKVSGSWVAATEGSYLITAFEE